MAGKGQPARLGIRAENGDVVAALITGVQEPAGGIEAEAARIVSVRSFLSCKGQLAVSADGEDPDAVVQAVAAGDIAPSQAAQIISALGGVAKIVEATELLARITALEEKQNAKS